MLAGSRDSIESVHNEDCVSFELVPALPKKRIVKSIVGTDVPRIEVVGGKVLTRPHRCWLWLPILVRFGFGINLAWKVDAAR